MSSGVSPEALLPEALGCPRSKVSKNSLTVFYSNVIEAFACRPNTSGSSSLGNASTCARTLAIYRSIGEW